ncbi:MAG: HAMP domain-containing protein [Sandaracinaceae bacterium]|nr:MAG: HAMP domain-containing protein [Sandaracinaceae bacterium]
MTRSLRARLLGSMFVVTALVVGSALFIADPLVRTRAKDDVVRALDLAAADALRGGDRDPAAHVTWIDAEGEIASRTGGPGGGVADLDHVRHAGRDLRELRDDEGRRWLQLSLAQDDGRVLRVARRFPERSAARTTMWQVLLFAGFIALLASALLAEYLTRSLARPLAEMTRAADALKGGDMSVRVRSRRHDELGALGAAIDQMADQLSERYEAVRREEERLRTILDAMIEGVFVTDANGRIVLTNAALARLAGDDLEGRTAVEAIRSAELHGAVRRATAGEAGAVDFEIVAGGQRRSIAAQVAPLEDREGVVAVLHDVSQLKRADAVRRDFVANASHELRTPLTAIRGFAETLRDGALSDERMAKRFTSNIADNAKRLENLVGDLIELSKAESPDSRVDLMATDVVQAIAKVLRGFETRASDKGQQLELTDAGVVLRAWADARALDQVLLNLVDNAIKYTPEGGRITVGARLDEDKVIVEVSDTGPGISRAHLDRIFERFYRVDKGRARDQGGTGLGLSIVKHLVSRMDGDVTVESEVGEGTTFRVTLQAAA